jgi:hypothetical protein
MQLAPYHLGLGPFEDYLPAGLVLDRCAHFVVSPKA